MAATTTFDSGSNDLTMSGNGTNVVIGSLRIRGNDSYPVYFRRGLELDAPIARYPGFEPQNLTLKAGTIRRRGARALTCDIVYQRDVPVTLRDGTVIYTDIFRPTGNETVPGIIAWSPYGKEVGGQWLDDIAGRDGVALSEVSELQKFEGPDPAYWVAQGYAVLNPDARGSYSSGGNITFWGRQLAEDGFDFVEWAAKESWSNGKLAFSGNSWLAVSQWFIAAEQPPHLAAIAPWEGLSDLYRESARRGGIPQPGFNEMIVRSFAGDFIEDTPRMTITEPLITSYWEDKIALLENITVPAYVVASYTNAVHTHGTFAGFNGISSEKKWLRVHNSSEWPDYYQSENVADLKLFFDHYLKGINNAWEKTPRVRYAILDAGGIDTLNNTSSQWPPARMQPRLLYLNSDTSLGASPSCSAATVRYAANNSDGVTFTYTVPEDMDIIGNMKLKLWVEALYSDDMDLSITVQKVMANGTAYSSSSGGESTSTTGATGVMRVSLRNLDDLRSTFFEPFQTFDRTQPLSAGEIVPVEIGLWPTAQRFHAGEHLAVTIAPQAIVPSNYTMGFGEAIVPVPAAGGTFEPGQNVTLLELGGSLSTNEPYVALQEVATPDSPNRGTHVIHVGGVYQSYLLFPARAGSAGEKCT